MPGLTNIVVRSAYGMPFLSSAPTSTPHASHSPFRKALSLKTYAGKGNKGEAVNKGEVVVVVVVCGSTTCGQNDLGP